MYEGNKHTAQQYPKAPVTSLVVCYSNKNNRNVRLEQHQQHHHQADHKSNMIG